MQCQTECTSVFQKKCDIRYLDALEVKCYQYG